jgi:hypothetical protein
MREQVPILNDNLAQLHLRHHGRKVDIPIGRQIFDESFDRGGRFYCDGTSFPNMPAVERRPSDSARPRCQRELAGR